MVYLSADALIYVLDGAARQPHPPKHTFLEFDVTNYSALRLVLQEERLLWPLLTSLGNPRDLTG